MSNSDRMMEAVKEIAEYFQKIIQKAIQDYDEGAFSKEPDAIAEKIEQITALNDFVTKLDCIFINAAMDINDGLCITSLLNYQSMREKINTSIEYYSEILNLPSHKGRGFLIQRDC